MSMFSGLGSQISGFVAQKMGKGGEGAPPEGGEPQEVPQENGEGGEGAGQEGGAGGPLGGAMGFAQGLMMKAAAAKEGIKEKASGLSAGNLQAPFGGGGAAQAEGYEGQYSEQQMEGGEEGAEGQQPTGGPMGFAAGLMMKAHTLKEGVKEKSSGISLGNVQSMAGGVMSQVQGIIPGMRRGGEEEVPDPAPQEEYQEYQEEQYQE